MRPVLSCLVRAVLDVELRATVLACLVQAALDVELGTFSECLDLHQIGSHLLSLFPLPPEEGEVGRTAVRPY
jgi:hypothetical protein